MARQSDDHAVLHRLMQQYEAAPDDEARGRIVADLAQRALRHAFAEETVLFPAYRQHLPGHGDELTAHVEGEHQQINDLLEELQDADPAAAGYDDRVRRVFTLIDSDAREEEDVMLPRLQSVVDDEELRTIGDAWEAARATAPTRPHPRVPRRPPGNALAALPLAVSDRIKDGLDRLPRGARRVSSAAVLALAACGGAAVAAGVRRRRRRSVRAPRFGLRR
ncbi:hemerythrin domain-containing protein [Jiangella ureilytica]|uniref:Hemerythrin domain-containing protein n=1 Tax=Jiangella ureilytica TaxID=2530374 RepID=A0A4R4RQV4_9ACTN|nr:hemerythrin domain-containing protein [Jiangella ureilytica]